MAKKHIKTKKVAKKPNTVSPRRIAAPKKRGIKFPSLKRNTAIKPQRSTVPAARKLFWQSLNHIYKNWKLYGGITLVYFILSVVLVKGFDANSTLMTIKASLVDLTSSKTAGVSTGLSLFGFLVSSNGPQSEVASVYQMMLITIASLALIWSLRQSYSDKKVKARQAFYGGMYPLIPFILVVLVIILQTLPLMLANTLYTAVFIGGLAVNIIEQILWGLALFLLILSSLYMVTASIFGLYIVTLPNMTPLKALRSAKGLVRYRRWTIMRKVLFLPMVLIVVGGVVTVPVVIYATPFAEWLFFGLTIVSLSVIHSYLYALYRELMV